MTHITHGIERVGTSDPAFHGCAFVPSAEAMEVVTVTHATRAIGTIPTPMEARELERVEQRLIAEFAPELSPRVVHDVVHDVVDGWAGAPVRQYIPLLTERYAREQLRHLHH